MFIVMYITIFWNIHNYTNNKNKLYSWLLDASKSFYFSSLCEYLKALFSKDILRYILRFIINSYIRQTTCVTHGILLNLHGVIHVQKRYSAQNTKMMYINKPQQLSVPTTPAACGGTDSSVRIWQLESL